MGWVGREKQSPLMQYIRQYTHHTHKKPTSEGPWLSRFQKRTKVLGPGLAREENENNIGMTQNILYDWMNTHCPLQKKLENIIVYGLRFKIIYSLQYLVHAFVMMLNGKGFTGFYKNRSCLLSFLTCQSIIVVSFKIICSFSTHRRPK